MKKTLRAWISVILAALLVFAAAAAPAEEKDEAQGWIDLANEALQNGDSGTAADYFFKAAEQGNAEAQMSVGHLYFYGLGLEQSYEKAQEYWELAGAQGNAVALINLGYMYAEGLGAEQSWEKAAGYFATAADLGDPVAMDWIGACYAEGLGVEQSWEKATEYYKASADLGEPEGMIYMGLCHRDGNGVEQSYEKAMEYWELAVEQNDDYFSAIALLNMGALYEKGQGVEQSPEKAKELYERAAALGSEEALEWIRNLTASGDHGLAQTEGIEIPDYTKETVKEFPIPQETESIRFVRNLKAGWNLGNTFDAYRQGSYTPPDYETFWSGAKTTPELIHAIKEAGFNLIRIPVSWHDHLTGDDWTIDPAWMARVKEVAGWALAEDMYVIVNIHHDNSKEYLYPDTEHYEQSERYITAIWSQVAEAFAEYDEHVLFEAMNEPRLVGTDWEWNPNPAIPEVLDAMQCINKLNRKFVETVRASGGNNETRFLLVPGYSGSSGGAAADVFEVPADDRIIIEVHAYTPYDFALNTQSEDSSFDLQTDRKKKAEIAGFMTELYEKRICNGTAVLIDEFGALYKKDDDLQARVNFAAFYTAMASARGMPVVWWDNSAFSGNGERFGLIDRNRVEWVYPDIALAIVTNCRVNRSAD